MHTYTFQRFTKQRNSIKAYFNDKHIATITRSFDYDEPTKVSSIAVEWIETNGRQYNFQRYCYGRSNKVLKEIKADIKDRHSKS